MHWQISNIQTFLIWSNTLILKKKKINTHCEGKNGHFSCSINFLSKLLLAFRRKLQSYYSERFINHEIPCIIFISIFLRCGILLVNKSSNRTVKKNIFISSQFIQQEILVSPEWNSNLWGSKAYCIICLHYLPHLWYYLKI